VAEAFVDQEAAHRKIDRHGDLRDEVGVAARDELLLRRLDRETIHFGLVVDRQRVVHVEADPSNPRHAQVAVAEDATGARDGRCLLIRELFQRKDELICLSQACLGNVQHSTPNEFRQFRATSSVT
jgi:hypothetical protein